MPLPQPLKVLYCLHPGLDTLDFVGPFEVFSYATHKSTLVSSDDYLPAFQSTITIISEYTTTHQGLTLKCHIPVSEAYTTLADYDVLVIPGGGSLGILASKAEPSGLVAAFANLPKKEGKLRTLLSVCARMTSVEYPGSTEYYKEATSDLMGFG